MVKANPYIGLSLSRMKFGVSGQGRRGMHDKLAFDSQYNQLCIIFGPVSIGCCELTTEQRAMMVKEVEAANSLLEHPTSNLSGRIAKAGLCVLLLGWLKEQVQSFKWRGL
jgi:hypothetical protein